MGLLRNIRTAFALAAQVNQLVDRMEEIELEWADKRDAFTLLLKRLATRAARGSPDGDGTAGDEPVPAAASAAHNKDQLRALARSRGLMR